MERRILGDYEIIKPLGQGTLGQVFFAEHRFMKQHYALKILPEELSQDRGFIQRFQEETGRLTTLDHPHINKIHNVSFADGVYFLVSDCVVDEMGESLNLAQYLTHRGSPLDEEEVFQLLKQVGQALDYAHQRSGGGVVHRGLKLNNILIEKGQRHDIQVTLTDIGLTRIIGVGAVLTRLLRSVAEGLEIAETLQSQKYPNPPVDMQKQAKLHDAFSQAYHFLAPEQKNVSKASEVNGKADVYAFGVLAYYLLTGHYPEGAFEPPLRWRTEFERDWNTLVYQCLQYEPAKRPENLESLLQDMGVEALEPVAAGAVREQAKAEAGERLKPKITTRQLERPSYEPDPHEMLKVDTGVKPYTPEEQSPDLKELEPIMTDMVIVKGGKFWRGSKDGSRDEMPYHEIAIKGFAIDIHPVTNEQFVRFLEVMGGEKDANNADMIRLKESRIRRSGGKISIESGYGKHPVVGVTWYGAVAYARWVGKRLPTEAEWEVAAAAGAAHHPFPTGDAIEKKQANFFSSDTIAVMSYPPTALGLYDMAGNVYEWCQDWYSYNYYETSALEPEDPKGPVQGVYRVLRGGCWKSLKEDLRCAHRHRNNPGTVNGTYGFRCAADVE